MTLVVDYLKFSDDPTSEAAHNIIDKFFIQNNCESPEGHIVSSGLQTAEPHHQGSGLIQHGVPIVIDIFPQSTETGYWADMTRTVCLGEPSDEIQNMYDTVLAAQQLAINNIRPGVKCRDLHTMVADYFDSEGYKTGGQGKEFRYAYGFVHALGHGVNTEIHADPKISVKSNDILQSGDVITIEPGLYYPEIGGIRIEDMLLVTADGCEILTNYPKDFII